MHFVNIFFTFWNSSFTCFGISCTKHARTHARNMSEKCPKHIRNISETCPPSHIGIVGLGFKIGQPGTPSHQTLSCLCPSWHLKRQRGHAMHVTRLYVVSVPLTVNACKKVSQTELACGEQQPESNLLRDTNRKAMLIYAARGTAT